MNQLTLSADDLARRIQAARSNLGPGVPDPGSFVVTSGLTAAVEPDPNDDRRLTFILATADVNRNGWQLNPLGWEFANFLRNPVMLWAHDDASSWKDSGSHGLPFAKAERVWIEGDLLKIACLWAEPGMITGEAGELCESVLRLYRGGYLSAVSAGWIPLEWEFVQEEDDWKIMCARQELVEGSFVPIPAEPNALRQAAAAGMIKDVSTLRRWAAAVLGEPRFILRTAADQATCDRLRSLFADFYPAGKLLILPLDAHLAPLDQATAALRELAAGELETIAATGRATPPTSTPEPAPACISAAAAADAPEERSILGTREWRIRQLALLGI